MFYMYRTQLKGNGSVIDYFNTIEKAEKAISEYMKEDDLTLVKNFYDIAKFNAETGKWTII